jgi:starch synthase
MKIAMFASEANPLAKSGGLADVVYSLSVELAKKKNDVIIALPFYRSIWKKYQPQKVGSFDVYMSWRRQEANIYSLSIKGVDYYLIDNAYYFDREQMYGYGDDGERFAFFALACRQLLSFLKFKADIVHVHDWQTAIIPCLIKEQNSLQDFYSHMKFVLTIHNPAFKGMIDRYFLNDFYGLSDSLYDNGRVRFEGMVSTLKAGIVYADKITTVSPTHREELLSPNNEHGLSGVLSLRSADFVGVVNGIDVDEWNPQKDTNIAFNYSAKNLEEGKHKNQSDLLSAFNCKWFGGPVYGLVSRLSWQKGIDLVLSSGRKALQAGSVLIILGSGEYALEQRFEALHKEFPDTCGIFIGYNNVLAHKIYAGCDFFLMPSLFEPCGISQMIAQRYGDLPIVRYTGGLCDTVKGYLGDGVKDSTGIGFNDYNVQGLDYAFGLSRQLYSSQKEYYEVARNAMKLDRSWKQSANFYEGIYREIVAKN